MNICFFTINAWWCENVYEIEKPLKSFEKRENLIRDKLSVSACHRYHWHG